MGNAVCEDNTLDSYPPPTTGGPWAPAFNPATGAWIYVNVGALEQFPVPPPPSPEPVPVAPAEPLPT